MWNSGAHNNSRVGILNVVVVTVCVSRYVKDHRMVKPNTRVPVAVVTTSKLCYGLNMRDTLRRSTFTFFLLKPPHCALTAHLRQFVPLQHCPRQCTPRSVLKCILSLWNSHVPLQIRQCSVAPFARISGSERSRLPIRGASARVVDATGGVKGMSQEVPVGFGVKPRLVRATSADHAAKRNTSIKLTVLSQSQKVAGVSTETTVPVAVLTAAIVLHGR